MEERSGELLDQSAAARDARAAAFGLVVVLPGARDLFVDIDGNKNEFMELKRLAETAGIHFVSSEVWQSKTHGNYHAHLVTAFDLTPELRIALQTALGSDRKREVLSIASALRKDVPPTVFFETEKRAAALAAAQPAASDTSAAKGEQQ